MTAADRPSVGDQITTAEQLEMLPRGTVLLDHTGVAWQRDLRNRPREDMWLCAGGGPQGLEQPYFVGYYGPFTVLYVPGEQSRPSVTDNARAAVRGAAMDLYRALRRANPDAYAEVEEVEDWAYWEDIVRTAQVTPAAGRAETTTATAAARALWEHDNSEGTTPEWRDMAWNDMGGSERSEERVEYELRAQALADAGLLATARTRPTREQVIDALVMSPLSDTAGTDLRPFEQTADAVLALLGGDTRG